MSRFSFQKRFLLIGVLLCGIVGTVHAQPRTVASHLRSGHKESVEQWLAQRPNLRVAVDADCACKSHLTAERAGFDGYHPYYLVADFNGDKKDDFAIALVDTQKRTAKFALAIFNGPVGKSSAPAFFRQGLEFRRMAFSAADGIVDKRRTTLFVQNPNTGKGLMLRLGRKGYFLEPSQEDFN